MSAKNDEQNIWSHKKHMQRKRSLNECYAEAKKVESECSGVRKKRMDVRSFRAQFRPKQNMPSASASLDASQRKDGDTPPLCQKEGNNNCMRVLANDRGKECLKCFDDGAIDAGKLVSTSRIAVDVGEAELLNSRSKGSNIEESSEPPGMKPSITSNVVGETLTNNTCFGVEVSPELEMIDCDSVGASTGFNVLKKSNQSIDSKNLDPICDLVKVCQKVVGNGVNPSHGEELDPGHRIRHANQSLPVPAVGSGTSSPSPALSLKSHDIYLPERNQDLSVDRLISNGQNSIHVSRTAEMEKKCEILALKRWEEKRLLMEKNKEVEAAIIRQIYSQNVVMRVQKLKMLDYDTSRKLEEHKKLMEAGHKDLKAKHLAGIIENREVEFQWLAKHGGTENRTDEVPVSNFPATGHTPNKVVDDLQSCDASVSDLPVGCTTQMESDCLGDELVNDLHTSNGSQSDATVHAMVVAVDCDIPSSTISTPSETVNNLHSKDHNLLDVCLDAAKEAEGCAVHMETGNAPEIPTSDGLEVTVTERTSVLRDGQFFKHPRSDGETYEKLPSASNVVDHHYIQRTSNGERHDKLFSGQANEPVPVPEDARKKLRSIDDKDSNTNIIQSNGDDDGDDRVFCSDTHNLLANQRDDTNGTGPHPDQVTLVAHPRKGIDSVDHAIAAPISPVPEDSSLNFGSIDDPDTNTTVIQSKEADENGDRVICSDTPDLQGNQRGDANGTDPDSDQTTLVAHPHEGIDSVDHAISAPMRQATTDGLPQCAISAEVQGEDQTNQDKLSHFVESTESENVAQLFTTHDLTAVAGAASSGTSDNGLTAEPNHPTCFEQQQPSTEHVSLGPESGIPANQMINNGSAPLQATETTYQVEKPPNHSQHQPQVRENLFESSSSDIRNPNIGNNRCRHQSISNQSGEPNPGLCASFQRVGQPSEPSVVDGGLAQRISRAVIQAANQLGLSNSHLSLQADPLQIELEKLRKAIEQLTKGHEDLKSQLRSDCEKEIAEVVAEIGCKYEAKIQDAEAIFRQKQNTLDANVNKVFSNKILANAVTTKWIDVRSSGFQRQQGSMQQSQQRSVQPTQEPANVGLSSDATTPAAQQNTSLNLLVPPRATALSVGASCRPPIISSTSRPQSNARVGGDIRAAAPHIQFVRPDSRAAAPHLQVVGADIRTVAPHLQPFRPPVSVPASHHSLPQSQSFVNQPSLGPIQPSRGSP